MAHEVNTRNTSVGKKNTGMTKAQSTDALAYAYATVVR